MDVCLVSMPYAAIERPSIALGLLAAELRGAGISIDCRYGCLEFAERIGLLAYDALMKTQTTLFAGEWTFAPAAFPEMHAIDEAFMATMVADIERNDTGVDDPRAMLLAVREEASRYVSDLADAIVASRPRIVGCTSMFQQHVPSLALLRAIRERDPGIITMIGGTNCDEIMGAATKRLFPWVDHVISGEADELIVPLVRDLLDGRSASVSETRASVWNMDAIPTPDYDDYFAALERSPLRDAIEPAVVVETSRGCWWGAKSHCTFCGLNGGNMAYRAKSPERAVEEFHRLAARYGVRRFTVVDNIIDMQYHQRVLPKLVGHGYDIFYETKANLRRQHMEGFNAAGVRSIQPGMESFHDELLRLMAKGNKAWMNVQLLKWAAELGMSISWVFLIDIPRQRDEWYLEMLSWLPMITHLAPPFYAVPIEYVRFSPYHRDAEQYGFDLVPEPAYHQVYPFDDDQLRDLVYYFANRGEKPYAGIGQQLLVAWLGVWRDQHRSSQAPLLTMRRDDDAVEIVDTRSCATASQHRLTGLAARVYLDCDEATDRRSLVDRHGAGALETIESLRRDQLLLDLGGKLLALAVDVTRPKDQTDSFPGGRVNVAAMAQAR